MGRQNPERAARLEAMWLRTLLRRVADHLDELAHRGPTRGEVAAAAARIRRRLEEGPDEEPRGPAGFIRRGRR